MTTRRIERPNETYLTNLVGTTWKVSLIGILTLVTLCVGLTALSGQAEPPAPLPGHDGEIAAPGVVPVSPSTSLSISRTFASTAPYTLSHSVFLPLIVVSRPHDAVIVDGPWTSLPPGAGSGLTLDREWDALTLQSDMTNLAFVLEPDPDKEAYPNSVEELGGFAGRIYLGYGDLINNRGPVDIVSYNPLSGDLLREMIDIPEEAVGGWHTAADGRFYAGGQDAQENWTFGNLYMNDGLGWQKRRTIYKGLHVMEIVDFQGRLYANYSSDGTSPVTYTFALVSDNQGTSWSYEPIDQGAVQYSGVGGMDTVIHATGEFLYAIVYLQPTGSEDYVERLYRFDGNAWEQISISDPLGEFSPLGILAFQDQMLVHGYVIGTSHWDWATYALDGQTQTEVAFLRDRFFDSQLCDPHDGWLYCILEEPPYNDPNRAYSLYRTQDGQAWEMVGLITLLPGARQTSTGSVHGRFYVGATNAGWWDVPDGVELWPTDVYTIENATLQWDAEVPDGAQLTLKIRTATGYSDIFDRLWVGPDGTENTVFTVSGETLHTQHNGDTFWQVAIYKTPNGNDEFPLIRWVTLDTSNGSVTLAVDEGQGLYTAANTTDSNGVEYLSPVFRLQEPIVGGNLFFEGATPDQTSLRFQLRSALTEDQLAQQQFAGPDGTPTTFYQSSGQALWAGHSGDIYIQYRAVLTSLDPTLAPFLRKVVLVTQSDKLDHFSIQLGGSATWSAGRSNPVTVTASLADGRAMPIYGKVSLAALDMSQSEILPVQPTELNLINGIGTVNVSLQRATPTQICASLAGVMSCGPALTVQPGAAAAVSVTTDLPEPYPNWSPVGQVGQPFTLSLTILDRYRNIVPSYTGTVRCERWRWTSEAQLLVPPYTFQPSDQGYHEFPSGVTIEDSGEWNLVCFDEADPRIAGAQTVNIQ